MWKLRIAGKIAWFYFKGWDNFFTPAEISETHKKKGRRQNKGTQIVVSTSFSLSETARATSYNSFILCPSKLTWYKKVIQIKLITGEREDAKPKKETRRKALKIVHDCVRR